MLVSNLVGMERRVSQVIRVHRRTVNVNTIVTSTGRKYFVLVSKATNSKLTRNIVYILVTKRRTVIAHRSASRRVTMSSVLVIRTTSLTLTARTVLS
jgi:hypothetical protein